MSENKKIEIVSGDENDLNISPVRDNISAIKPQSTDKRPKNIVIPPEKKETQDEKEKDKDNQ